MRTTIIMLGLSLLVFAISGVTGDYDLHAVGQQPVPTETRPSVPTLPTFTPLPEPTLTPTVNESHSPKTLGGKITLRVFFPKEWPWEERHWQTLWTAIQWQDAYGDWHRVEGWQGELDDIRYIKGSVVAEKSWWFPLDGFRTGTFRWVVYQEHGGKILSFSEPFIVPVDTGTMPSVDILLTDY